MVKISEPRYLGDELTLALLRRLAAGAVSPSAVASELFTNAADREGGPITAEALHIAAEATTDNDLRLARGLWLQLLQRVSPTPVTTSTMAVTVEHLTV